MTFEDYVATRGPALVRLARLLTGDEHRAEDLVQEVLGRAFVKWRSIRRTDRPDVYLRRMLVNANASWWRRRSNREAPAAVEVATTAADRAASTEKASVDPSVQAAERDAMWRLITRLPERQRTVVVLRYYEDLDDVAIAEILGCTPVTVRTHAMRALATLRAALPAAEPAGEGGKA